MIITNPPPTQEIIAAGPATCAAYSDPKSHPDPMIDPSEKKSSPSVLTSLCSLRPSCADPRSSVCVAITNPPSVVQQTSQHTFMVHVARLPSVVGMQPCQRPPSRPCRVVSLGDDRLSLPFRCKADGIVGHRSARSKCPRGPWHRV